MQPPPTVMHTPPLPCMPPTAMHAPLPCMPTPCHVCPPHHAQPPPLATHAPPAMHAPSPHDMVSERAVRILLECILVFTNDSQLFISIVNKLKKYILINNMSVIVHILTKITSIADLTVESVKVLMV